jgi:predicted ribosomally synthesized peptide with SipW-like signal peptide
VKKLLFAVIACVLCAGMVGGVFAYFTDVASSTNNVMSAGTLNIQIADNDETFTEGPVSASFNSPVGLAPGQSFDTGVVSIKNAGTINIAWVWARFGGLTESVPDMSKKLIMTHYWEKDPGGSWVDQPFDAELSNIFLNYWIGRGAGAAGMTADDSISLWDLVTARNYGSGDKITSLLLMNDSVKAQSATGNLPAGSIVDLCFTFQLDPTTGNAYQGAWAVFSVDFIGSQYNGYPDEVLSDYITQPLH